MYGQARLTVTRQPLLVMLRYNLEPQCCVGVTLSAIVEISRKICPKLRLLSSERETVEVHSQRCERLAAGNILRDVPT